jgi:outer membrane protein assembly factor BamB
VTEARGRDLRAGAWSHTLVRIRTRLVNGTAAVAAIVASAAVVMTMTCAHLEPTTCGSDKDCKLQRVCDLGRCVWSGSRTDRSAAVVPSGGKQPAGSQALSLALPPTETEPARTMFRFGPLHRGRSPYLIPAKKPSVDWATVTGGPISSSPALLDDGSVAFASHDQHLYIVGRDGTLKWSHATSDIIFSSPAVGLEGTIYIGSDDDHLYALGPSQKPLWIFQIGSCPQHVGVGPDASRCDVDAGPTLGPGGVIYTGGDGIYAINPDGTLRWRFATGGHVSSAPAVLPDGTVIAGCQDDMIYAVAPDGTKRWDFRTGGDVESSPAVSEDGTIYVGSDDQKLYALALDGSLRWAFTTGDDIRASAALAPGGLVLIGSFDSQLYAIKPDGTLAWTFRTGDRIVSSALVDAKGAVLFGSQDDRVYALEADGRFRWSVELGGDVDSSPILAADGTIYVGSDDKKLYALRVPSGQASGPP